MIRPKGNLERSHYILLGLLLGVPLVLIGLRSLFADNAWVADLSLTHLSARTQKGLLHALFVPLAAVIVVFCRITLGLRLMGPFRSIILAMAFQATGIHLGLSFLALVLGSLVLIRPVLKEMKLTYYARVSFILGAISAMIVLGIIAAAWFGGEYTHRVASFPIIALCLTADSFAATLKRDGVDVALWRVFTSVAVGILIACVTQAPGLATALLAYPELLFLQLGLIVVISEHLDLRLLEGWNIEPQRAPRNSAERAAAGGAANAAARRWPRPLQLVSRWANRLAPIFGQDAALAIEGSSPRTLSVHLFAADAPDPDENEESPSDSGRFRVAVVRNRKNTGIIAKLGRPCPEVYGKRTVQNVLDALRQCGFEAKAFEADMSMLRRLKSYLGPTSLEGRPRGLVFNMAYGIQGDCRYTHAPAMFEMAGLPYTGASPFGHALSLDKVLSKILMERHGVPTPPYAVMATSHDSVGSLTYPLIVKPRHESTSYGLRIVHDREQLEEAVDFILETYRQEALVEQFIDGREVCIGLLGNAPVEVLPIVELDFGGRPTATMTWEDKYHKTEDEPTKVCPARLDARSAERLRQLARDTFRACACRDYARVDIRIDRQGNPYVLEINSMASLGGGGSYVMSAKAAGYDFASLLERIVDVAHQRYFGEPAPRALADAACHGPIETQDHPCDVRMREISPELHSNYA